MFCWSDGTVHYSTSPTLMRWTFIEYEHVGSTPYFQEGLAVVRLHVCKIETAILAYILIFLQVLII